MKGLERSEGKGMVEYLRLACKTQAMTKFGIVLPRHTPEATSHASRCHSTLLASSRSSRSGWLPIYLVLHFMLYSKMSSSKEKPDSRVPVYQYDTQFYYFTVIFLVRSCFAGNEKLNPMSQDLPPDRD